MLPKMQRPLLRLEHVVDASTAEWLDDSSDTFHSCIGSIQRRDAAEAGKQQWLEK